MLECHQGEVALLAILHPLIQGQSTMHGFGDASNQFGRPLIVLSPFGTHAGVRRSEFCRVRLNSSTSIEIRCFKWPDHRPTSPQPVAHDSVDIFGFRYAIANETVGLAKKRPL